ncbi:unnamed protein product, partial [Allacma fusca]
ITPLVLPLWCGILVKGLQDLDFKENDVTLIVPQVAVVNSDVSMECRFNPKGTSIYSVKWYKGEGAEFFRFSPKERPEKKFFEIPGLEKLVVVDMNHSDMNKIYLRGIPMKLTGNISCEVTPEPSFKPIQKYQFITVIAPPETPTLEILPKLPQNFQPRNNPLTLICKVGPSKPVANITFYINNSPYIPEKHQVKSVPFMDDDKDKYKGFQAREAQLNITLTSEHFNESKVEIHCGASIYNITRNSDKYETQQINSPKQFSYKHDSNSSGQVIWSLANSLPLYTQGKQSKVQIGGWSRSHLIYHPVIMDKFSLDSDAVVDKKSLLYFDFTLSDHTALCTDSETPPFRG